MAKNGCEVNTKIDFTYEGTKNVSVIFGTLNSYIVDFGNKGSIVNKLARNNFKYENGNEVEGELVISPISISSFKEILAIKFPPKTKLIVGSDDRILLSVGIDISNIILQLQFLQRFNLIKSCKFLRIDINVHGISHSEGLGISKAITNLIGTARNLEHIDLSANSMRFNTELIRLNTKLLTKVEKMKVNGVNIKTEFLKYNKKLKEIKFKNSIIQKPLDFSNNKELESIELETCSTFNSKLITTNLNKLRSISILETDISEVNFSTNTNLEDIYLKKCKNIHTIDISKNIALRDLGILTTGITQTDISNNSNLESLRISPSNTIINFSNTDYNNIVRFTIEGNIHKSSNVNKVFQHFKRFFPEIELNEELEDD